MAKVIWTEPALSDLNDLAEYIALSNSVAAAKYVERVFKKVERLERFPNSGRRPPELDSSSYREVVLSPCRIFYRIEENSVYIVHLMRQESELRKFLLGVG